MVARLLTQEGYTVQLASNCREALLVRAPAGPDPPDMMLPGMDGLTFLEHLRRDPRWRAVRVIVFSGYDEHVNVARLERLGVGHVLQKGSVDPAHILELVG